MTPRLAGLVAAFLALAGASAPCEDAVPEPEGYRNADYRAPTPQALHGARVVTTSEAAAIWKTGTAIFVDVMPHPPRPSNLPAGTIWREKPRSNIPGSIWLPDTGYGELAASTESYLRTGLERMTGGDRTKVLVVYCLRECWMSWNAAKRAVAMGYTSVAWFPEGTDGWADAGLPLEAARPAQGRADLNPATAGSPDPARTGAAR